MLHYDDSRDTHNQEPAQRTAPAVSNCAEQRRHNKTHHDCEPVDITMLPSNQRVFLQIGDVIERRIRFYFEQKPADMRVPESFRDAVRIVMVVIDKFMMAS